MFGTKKRNPENVTQPGTGIQNLGSRLYLEGGRLLWSKTIMEGFLEELQPEVKPKTLESWSCRYSPLLVSSCPVNSLTSEPHLIFLLTIHGIINALALNSKFLFPENGLNLPPRPTPALSLPSSHTQGTCYALNTSRIFYPSAFGQVMPFVSQEFPLQPHFT